MIESTHTEPPMGPNPSGRVLLVDDNPETGRANALSLRRSGYDVVEVTCGESASRAILQGPFDLVLSEIALPQMDGIALLRLMRTHDEDLPVVLVTGAPDVQTAMDALEYGAFKYLVKPVSPERLDEVVQAAVRLRRLASTRSEAMLRFDNKDDIVLEANFTSAMASMWLAYQPIVGKTGELYGHEALLRSNEASLPSPGHILDAAERLDRLTELGRRIRGRAPEPLTDDGMTLFVNLHPRDLDDDELAAPDSPLARIAHRVVLEITERTSIEAIRDVGPRVAALRERGFRIAIDDLGAGYAGLTSFALLEPDIVKIDMSLVRNVDTMVVKQRLVGSITSLCRDMGILVVGEGVETRAERDTLLHLGCDLFQGYAIARPGRAFPLHEW